MKNLTFHNLIYRENVVLSVPQDNLVRKVLKVLLDQEVFLVLLVSVVPRVTPALKDLKVRVVTRDPWVTTESLVPLAPSV